MTKQADTVVEVGVLVAAAFDVAAQYSTDRQEIARMAARTVTHLLHRARKLSSVEAGVGSRRPWWSGQSFGAMH